MHSLQMGAWMSLVDDDRLKKLCVNKLLDFFVI